VSDRSCVCTFVPQDQQGIRPLIYGMGILVKVREVVPCARVIDAALGQHGQQGSDPGIVNVCFPFTERYIRIKGTEVAGLRPAGPRGEPSDMRRLKLTDSAAKK
jgi:hypothetical protein